ncbi:hypothetical protein [Methylobacterium sp. WL9]|uniref:hypothetical protein n=1 Tax=Methylobacterium sp. WL9 TaxID=2603898 RepID=UPI0011C91216|nr:hypothetical protein [Methylobacterium sp. WL9]TXN21541.1 hypothetical protein FV217_14115 [Methylobacterium sp. WL9]
MPDTALKNAMLERDRIASEINKIQQKLHDLRAERQKVDDWISAWHRFSGTSEENAEPTGVPTEQDMNIQGAGRSHDESGEKTQRDGKARGNPRKEVVAAEAIKIIEEEGRSVSRSELYEKLIERSVVVDGKDPQQVLSTMLWRAYNNGANIIRLKSGGYWLADRPHEETGYDPTQAPVNAGDPEEGPAKDLDAASTLPIIANPEVKRFMERTSEAYISKLSSEEADSLLDKIEQSSEIPLPLQVELVSNYRELSGIDYVKGAGFQNVFIELLKEYVKAFPVSA